jgi:hypothetical protein
MANFFARLRGEPRFNKVNLNRLNGEVRSLVITIRKLKKTIPTNFQTKNAFFNATKQERNSMNRAIVNFIKKYNKAVDTTNAAAAAVQNQTRAQSLLRQAGDSKPLPPLPSPNAAVQQARQATQQAANAAQKMQQQVAQAAPRNLITNLKNENLSNNTKINAAIKRIRGKNPNVNWTTVNMNGLTNAQKKVLTNLRNPFFNGLKRKPTPEYNLNQGNLGSMFKQAQTNQRQAAPLPVPRRNLNMEFLLGLGNRNLTNAEYQRVVRIANASTNPAAKKLANNIRKIRNLTPQL